MATVPVIEKCVADLLVLRSRGYRPNDPTHAPLGAALEGAAAGRHPLLVLFPGVGAQPLPAMLPLLGMLRCFCMVPSASI